MAGYPPYEQCESRELGHKLNFETARVVEKENNNTKRFLKACYSKLDNNLWNDKIQISNIYKWFVNSAIARANNYIQSARVTLMFSTLKKFVPLQK